MMKLSKYLFSFIMVTLLLLTVGCGDDSVSNANDTSNNSEPSEKENSDTDVEFEEMTLSFGHHLNEDHILHKHVEKFKELLEKKTDGKITVEIFANGQLGQQRDLIDGLGIGTVDMTIVDTGVLANFYQPLAIIDAPYIIKDLEHGQRVLGGKVGEKFKSDILKETGIKVLSLQPTSYRSTALIKDAVENPKEFTINDFEGLSVRVLDSPSVIEAFKRFNARPETIPTGEAYSAMESGVVQGMESNPAFLASISVEEVADYLVDTRHVLVSQAILMDGNKFSGYSEEVQNVIQEAVNESTDWFNSKTAEDDQNARNYLEENGVQIIDVDLEPFIEAAFPYTEQFVEKNGLQDIYELIKEAE